MGKKGSGGWFSTVKKKVFKSSPKDSKRENNIGSNNADIWQQQHDTQEVVSFEHFPAFLPLPYGIYMKYLWICVAIVKIRRYSLNL